VGDLGRHLPFLGRIDFPMNGHRLVVGIEFDPRYLYPRPGGLNPSAPELWG
jgi:hypothetical protein